MARKLDKTKVEMGNFIKVANQNPKPRESQTYYAIKLEDETGKKESWHLFTGIEVAKLSYARVAGSNSFKKGRLYYRHTIGRSTKMFAKIQLPPPPEGTADESAFVVVFTSTLLKRTGKRAKKNAEDIPEMSWLQDLRD